MDFDGNDVESCLTSKGIRETLIQFQTVARMVKTLGCTRHPPGPPWKGTGEDQDPGAVQDRNIVVRTFPSLNIPRGFAAMLKLVTVALESECTKTGVTPE